MDACNPGAVLDQSRCCLAGDQQLEAPREWTVIDFNGWLRPSTRKNFSSTNEPLEIQKCHAIESAGEHANGSCRHSGIDVK